MKTAALGNSANADRIAMERIRCIFDLLVARHGGAKRRHRATAYKVAERKFIGWSWTTQ